MDIRPIRDDEDDAAARRQTEALWGAPADCPEGPRLDVLAILVEAYEEKRWPIETYDPIEMLTDVKEQRAFKQKGLATLLAPTPRA